MGDAPEYKSGVKSTLRDREQSAVANRRLPAVTVLSAVSLGIVIDNYQPLALSKWLFASGLLWACWCRLYLTHRHRSSALTLLGTLACLGGAWHHLIWCVVPTTDLSSYASDQPRPIQLLARVERPPIIINPDAEESSQSLIRKVRTVIQLSATSLRSQDGVVPVSGQVRWEIQGEMPNVQPGQLLRIFGMLSLPGTSRNPGGFDFQKYLREKGIRTVLRSEFPECAQADGSITKSPWRYITEAQQFSIRQLKRSLDPEFAPLAVAMLLGPRIDISDELKQAFLESGTIHFLAISGMNVFVFAVFLWSLIRILSWPTVWQFAWLGLGVWGYVLITDVDPPVIRAAVLYTCLLLTLLAGQRGSPLNQLALAALVIVLRNPRDLFQVGAQLSFLAILAMHWLWSQSWFRHTDSADPIVDLEMSWWRGVLNWCATALWMTAFTTVVVWAFTLPLVLVRFHLISPIGIVVNIVLSLLMTLTLYFGYACLLLAMLSPWIAWFPGMLFQCGLTVFTNVVYWASELPGGHYTIPGPSEFWIAGFYLLLVPLGMGVLGRMYTRWGWRLIAIWSVCGLTWGIPPASNDGLRCTFLSVGHGAAVLLELPNRRTILCDAGCLEDADRADQAVMSTLLERGYSYLDAVIVSHADVDHFNAIPGLVRKLAIGTIFVSPTFLDLNQPSVLKLCESVIEESVPIRLIWSGDRLLADPSVQIEVLHPPWPRISYHDNSNSIVLSIAYAGQRILLTGDLEREGLASLLRQQPVSHTIMLSPHHGSQKANPPELARWAVPRWLVVSSGYDTNWAKLEETYGAGAICLGTSKVGAVSFLIRSNGEISVETHRQQPR